MPCREHGQIVQMRAVGLLLASRRITASMVVATAPSWWTITLIK
jgi:hypothetical protein